MDDEALLSRVHQERDRGLTRRRIIAGRQSGNRGDTAKAWTSASVTAQALTSGATLMIGESRRVMKAPRATTRLVRVKVGSWALRWGRPRGESAQGDDLARDENYLMVCIDS
jgi:hypothetical protein